VLPITRSPSPPTSDQAVTRAGRCHRPRLALDQFGSLAPGGEELGNHHRSLTARRAAHVNMLHPADRRDSARRSGQRQQQQRRLIVPGEVAAEVAVVSWGSQAGIANGRDPASV
jgi:hypothetical protein